MGLDSQLIAAYRYQIPLRSPLKLAHGTYTSRSGLLLKFQSEAGIHWGEAAPLPGFSLESLLETELALWHYLDGSAPFQNLPANLQFALDMGSTPLSSSTLHIKTAQLITTHTTPIQSIKPAQTLKIKVGQKPLSHEVEWLKMLMAQAPKQRFRLDANRQFTLDGALQFAEALGHCPQLEFIEEPCANLEQTRLFAAKTNWPIALDETLQHKNYQPDYFPELKALICKPTLIGSLARCQRLESFATQHQLDFVLSGAFESNLTHAYLSQLANSWRPKDTHGLDTLKMIDADLITPRNSNNRVKLLNENELELLWKH